MPRKALLIAVAIVLVAPSLAWAAGCPKNMPETFFCSDDGWKNTEPGVLVYAGSSIVIRLVKPDEHGNKFALYVGDQLEGSFSTLENAKLEGVRKHKELAEMGVMQ